MIVNGWVICPFCGKKLFPIQPETVIKNLPFKCKACKHKFNIST
ncbi:cysteine-rich KTR domain-containing protein [Anaerotruncus rubiinfantis]